MMVWPSRRCPPPALHHSAKARMQQTDDNCPSFCMDDWLMIPALVGLRLRGSSSVAKQVSDIRRA